MFQLKLTYDSIIIGGGPAGLSAALQALRAGLNILIVEKESTGGTINYTDTINNYLGISKISGFELANNMFNHVAGLGPQMIFGEAVQADLKCATKKIMVEVGATRQEFASRSIIIAVGLSRRKLECPGSNLDGVSYCALCSGCLYQGENAAVVGGGDSAAESALYLSNICAEVTLIVRKAKLSCNQTLEKQLKQKNNINILFNHEIKEIQGDGRAERIEFKGSRGRLKVSCVFVNIGQEPRTNIFEGVATNEKGYFLANEKMQTNIEGVFVAGDCVAKELRQIVTAVSDGSIASYSALKFLANSSLK